MSIPRRNTPGQNMLPDGLSIEAEALTDSRQGQSQPTEATW
jgi:hypothetical protein